MESSVTRIAILGSDTVLAALPATPVQLAHACHAAGFDMVFPASWGDELVAAHCLTKLGSLDESPAVFAACPHVIDRLTRVGPELEPLMIVTVAPPVAAARYLRAAFGDRPIHITYLGACPAAADAVIDERLEPHALFATFAATGIDVSTQPEFFDSTLPPDRRRYWSMPGGAPSADHVAAVDPRRTLIEIAGDEWPLELAERLVARENVLIDLAPQLGCACSGAGATRADVTAGEPPRAAYPILDPSIVIELEAPPRAPRRTQPNDEESLLPFGSTEDAPATHLPPSPPARALHLSRPGCVRPSVRTRDGVRIPRAFMAQRERRGRRRTNGVARRVAAVSMHRARSGGAGGTEARVPRSVVIELPATSPSVLPPPPAKLRPDAPFVVETLHGDR